MRSRTSAISRKEKIATPAPTTASALIPRKANSRRLATPSLGAAPARALGVWEAAPGLNLTRFVSVRCYRPADTRLRPSSSVRVRQRARIEEGALRDISPAQRRGAELDEAVVHPPGQVVLAAGLVQHFAGDLAEREICVGKRGLRGRGRLDETAVGAVQAIPQLFVDEERKGCSGLAKARIAVIFAACV